MTMLNVGDVVSRPKGFFTHKGAYLGSDLVLHNLPEKGVHISTLKEFAADNPIRVDNLSDEERSNVMSRAIAELNAAREYDLATNNCQHLVNRLRKGVSYSEGVLIVAGIVLLIAGYAMTRRH